MSQGSPRCPSAGGSAADILQRQPGCVPAFVGAMSKCPDLLFIWDSQSLKAESDWPSLYQMLRHALPGEGGTPPTPRDLTLSWLEVGPSVSLLLYTVERTTFS